MKIKTAILFASFFLFSAGLFAANEIYRPIFITPPEPPRAFRGAWLTVVASNQDWPSQPGLPVAQQKAELIALLDRAAKLHFNAIIFQVRPASDAMYASAMEPWSERLTGTQGRPPQPFYDPLAFAIQEAHKRGLELHAWFNPFRARNKFANSIAPNHISRTHPELIRHYGDQLWLDPGNPFVRDYVLRVVMDVVKRYDVDGVTFDDYFYPYPEKDSGGRVLEFPDYEEWKQFGLPEGYQHDDWRRANVDKFIQSVYQNIKAAKPWVKFGISPFGIWRPENPPSIRGLDAYASLYADSRQWLAAGWLDYFAPQLYWAIDSPQQSFPVLLKWWREQNTKNRHLWPALDAAAVGGKFSAEEIARQIQIERAQNVNGEILFHLRSVTENPALTNVIGAEYAQPALVPASPWLDSTQPSQPKLTAILDKNSELKINWQSSGGEPAWRWVLQCRAANNVWSTQILPANQTTQTYQDFAPDIISLRAVNRTGNLSLPASLKKITPVRVGKTPIYY
ncbi:MAG TPA: family 10 glycosylhydrolase [Verrucomicrobiae bacterium]